MKNVFGKRKAFDLEINVLDFGFRGDAHKLNGKNVAYDELLLADVPNQLKGWGEVIGMNTSEGIIVTVRRIVNNVQIPRRLKLNFNDKDMESLFVQHIKDSL